MFYCLFVFACLVFICFNTHAGVDLNFFFLILDEVASLIADLHSS